MRKTRAVLFLVENTSVPFDPRVWHEALTLHGAGYLACIISPKSTLHRQIESYCCINGIHIYRFDLPQAQSTRLAYMFEYGSAILKTFFLSLKIWRRHGFDVVHAANPPDLFCIFGLFYRCLGKKFVYDQHDLVPELFQIVFRGRAKLFVELLRWLEWCSKRCADVVIVPNQSFWNRAVKQDHCMPEKVVIVRNGPDLGDLETREQVAALPNFERRRYLLAYAGTMGWQDGVEYALYALYQLVHVYRRKDISAIFIGAGSALSAMKELVQQLGLDECVFFTGWLDWQEARRYLLAADIGLSPEPKNGLNERCTLLKVMDYMELGLPLVAFDLEETRFSARDAAFYARPNDTDDFARQIMLLLANEDLRRKLGVRGRKRIGEVLNWERSSKNLLAAYEALFSRGKQEGLRRKF